MNRADRRRIAKINSKQTSKNIEPRRARRKMQQVAFKVISAKLKDDQSV